MPVACNSHTQTTTMTTTFRIVLMLEAMGTYRLMRWSPRPTRINITTRFSKGILLFLPAEGMQSVAQCRRGAESRQKAVWRAGGIGANDGESAKCGHMTPRRRCHTHTALTTYGNSGWADWTSACLM